MAYCGPRGIPLSRFLAWPQSDQDAALAWQAREATRCPSCGTHEADWDAGEGGRRDAWVHAVRVCQGCVQLEQGRDRPDLQDMRGVHVVLTRNDAPMP